MYWDLGRQWSHRTKAGETRKQNYWSENSPTETAAGTRAKKTWMWPMNFHRLRVAKPESKSRETHSSGSPMLRLDLLEEKDLFLLYPETLPGPPSECWREVPLPFCRVGGERTILRYARAFCSPWQGLPPREAHLSLTDLGKASAHPWLTLVILSHLMG